MKIIVSTILTGLFILTLLCFPVGAVVNKISPGDVVYNGEGGLDITDAIGDSKKIAYWDPIDNPDTDEPYCLDIADPESYFIDPDLFFLKTGNWYRWDGKNRGELAFTVKEPSLLLKIRDETTQSDINNSKVMQGNLINFLIETNMIDIQKRSGYSPDDPFISLIMKSPDGNPITSLSCSDGSRVSLRNLPIDDTKWYLIGDGKDHTIAAPDNGWDTKVTGKDGELIYKTGVYSVQAKCNLNDMYDLYRAPDGSEYLGKSSSTVRKVEITGEKKTGGGTGTL